MTVYYLNWIGPHFILDYGLYILSSYVINTIIQEKVAKFYFDLQTSSLIYS